jgi:DNA-binding NtrC family response regulator
MSLELPAYRLFDEGRFLDAAAANNGRDADAVLAVELLHKLGFQARALAETERLLTLKELLPEQRARCLCVQSGQLREQGNFAAAVTAAWRAAEIARSVGETKISAVALIAILDAEFVTSAFHGSQVTALEARRAAIRTGDPRILALAHATFGRLEARVGRVERAFRHFEMARRSLRESPSLYLEAMTYIDEASALSLSGDNQSAVESARRAIELATASGWSRGVVAAAANAAFLSVILGRSREGERFLALAEKQRFSSPSYELALLETRAHLLLSEGMLTEALALLAEFDSSKENVSAWYRLATLDTRVRILNRQQRWTETVALIDEALKESPEGVVKPIQSTLLLRRALAVAASQSRLNTSDLPLDDDPSEWTLSMVGDWWLARALAVSNLSSARAASHTAHALRVYRGISDHTSESEALAIAPVTPANTEAPDFESAAGLFAISGSAPTLASEAHALINAAGCVSAACIVTRHGKGYKVSDLFGWTEQQALAAVKVNDTAATIDCGTYRDETLQVIVELPDDLERRCAFVAIKKLVATALTLDRYRRDEKQRAALWPAEALDGDPDCIWISEPIAEVVRVARRIGPTPLSVMITGESGTGKEMLARTIHRASERAGQILLPFNCTAVPREMLESQLFGYRKGAFTGADTAFAGVIRSAEGGTLFLDEIADVPVDLQPKLLRFLETHEIHPLGEPHPIKVDVRVIAATNANLEQLVQQGRFREDLFYRLNVVRLRLPPLRERREEIPALVDHYMQRFADQQKKGRLTLSDEALEYLLLYAWPGNIRQLANEVNRMVALAEPDATLTSAHLSAEIQATRRTIPAAAAPESEMRISLDEPLPDAVERLERMMVQAALDRAKGRVEEAAKILGISRKGLFLKRRRWGLGAP